jgi:predicted dehydrogenase
MENVMKTFSAFSVPKSAAVRPGFPSPRALSWNRRRFLAISAAAGPVLFGLAPRGRAAGGSRRERPRLAAVGVGGVGHGQVQALEKAGFEIRVLCDVDDVHAQKSYDRWPDARRYRDFREMFQAEGDRIDAVYCGVPDHTHAVIVMEALRRRKPICCVKPLTRTIHEARVLRRAAREAGVATQMTAAPNTSEAACRTCELIQAGALGPVREVHLWTNRPLWPQGMTRPPGSDPVPDTLDWDLWLGPAPKRPFKREWPAGSLPLTQVWASHGHPPFHTVYHPWNFRGWWDFGTGALGDMGCHYFNTPFRALRLRHPVAIEASSTMVTDETAPLASVVTYDFPARGGLPPVRLIWYDGGIRPPVPRELADDGLAPEGILYVGDEGLMLDREIFPESRARQFADVPRTLPRRGGTWTEFAEACAGGEPAGCAFDWAVPLTETVLLGNIAIRVGKPLRWDGPAGRFTNSDAANALVRQPYHNGWTLG